MKKYTLSNLQTINMLLERDYARVVKLQIPSKLSHREQIIVSKAEKLDIMCEKNHKIRSISAIVNPLRALTDLKNLPSQACSKILILDEIQDPHNLGAVMRSAAAFAVDAVIITKFNSAGITAAVEDVACGGCELVPVFLVTNLSQCIQFLQDNNFWLYATSLDAKQSLHEIKFADKSAIVLGNEHKGIRNSIQQKCDISFKIPMQQTINSLNISVAAGIISYYLSSIS